MMTTLRERNGWVGYSLLQDLIPQFFFFSNNYLSADFVLNLFTLTVLKKWLLIDVRVELAVI